jgi:hypothetical protein
MNAEREDLPRQPIEMDKHGVVRFRANSLVRYLLDAGGIDMSQIRLLPNIPREELRQFYQLIGYSVGGYEEVFDQDEDEEDVATAQAIAAEVVEDAKAAAMAAAGPRQQQAETPKRPLTWKDIGESPGGDDDPWFDLFEKIHYGD